METIRGRKECRWDRKSGQILDTEKNIYKRISYINNCHLHSPAENIKNTIVVNHFLLLAIKALNPGLLRKKLATVRLCPLSESKQEQPTSFSIHFLRFCPLRRKKLKGMTTNNKGVIQSAFSIFFPFITFSSSFRLHSLPQPLLAAPLRLSVCACSIPFLCHSTTTEELRLGEWVHLILGLLMHPVIPLELSLSLCFCLSTCLFVCQV